MFSHVGVNTGDMGLLHSPGKGREETVRLPLVRVLAPDGFVRVACQEVKDCYCVFGNRDLSDERSVLSADWFMKRENRVRSRSVDEIISLSLVL